MPFNYFSCLLICLLSPLVLSLPRLIIPNESNDYSLSTPEPSLFTSRILASQSQSGSTSEAVDTLTLHGSSLFGYYFTTLYFGTPAQKQTLIVDTGSTITTIPCNECGHNCGVAHFNDFYTPEKSTSHQSMECQESIGNYQCRNCNDGCRFSISYSEGSSYSGQFKKDYVSFEHSSKTALELVHDAAASKNSPSKPQSFRGLDSSQEPWMTDSGIAANDVTPNTPESRLFLPFGCTLQETNLFLTQEVDGILGLGILTNTDRNPPNLMDTISMKNSSISNAFSICFGQQGGYLALGGFNKTYHSKQDTVKYVPYDGQGGQYRVHWKNVKFQGKTLNIQESTLNRGKGAYIDSGTTLFYAPQDIADVIKGSLTEYCGQNSANCGGGAAKEGMCWMYDKKKYSNLQQFFATFGSFSLEFGQENSVEYEWKPEDYLFRIAGEKPFYCFGLDSIPPLPNERGIRTIFGGTFMKNHDILFDKSNKRIGFVRSDCTAEYNIATFPPSKHKDPLNKPNYFIVAILLVILLLLVSWLVAYYINQRNKMHGDMKIIPHLELGISPTRKSSSSSGSMESSSDLRLLSDGSSGSSLQELEEHFAV